MKTMIHILLVDRIRLVCEVIGAALEGEPDVHVVGIATSVDMALEMTAESETNLILVSTSLPDNGALELVRAVRDQMPEVKVLVIGLADIESVIMRYIEAGACGYVLREDGISELLHNIRAAFEDKALVTPVIAGRLMARIAELTEQLSSIGMDPSDVEELTPREKEILQLIGESLTNQEIASRLTIEVGTVKNHVHNILSKLNVNSRKDAALYASLTDDADEESTAAAEGPNA